MASLDDPLTTLKRARKDLAQFKERLERLRSVGERELTHLKRHRRIANRQSLALQNA